MEKNKYSIYRSISEWSQLNDADLKTEIKKIILGFGMAGSTSHFSFITDYYEHIKDMELKERVNKILNELMGDIESGVGERAIYICSNLQLEGIKANILEIIKKAEHLFRIIEKATEDKDWGRYISYIQELNSAIGLLKIAEAKDFLIRQLAPLKKSVPPPVTKEYYLYYGSAQSALSALKKLDPELAKKYECEKVAK